MVQMNLQEQYTVHTINKQHINKQWCGSTDYILHTVLLYVHGSSYVRLYVVNKVCCLIFITYLS